MAMARRSPTLNVMIEAAEKAGRSLLRDFGEVENLQVSKKGPGNFVSTADHKAEKTVMAVLSKARPAFGFLMEEGGEVKGEDSTTRWIIDPLDGTSNFLHGIPHWSVSIALEKQGEIIAGVVYDPIRDEMFWAEKGMGAYMNNRILRVAGRKGLSDALIGAYTNDAATATTLLDLYKTGLNSRSLGSACLDLSYVAAGRLDGFFHNRNIQPWDAAAGLLIVREAKGLATDMSGGKNAVYAGSIAAGNSAIHAEILKHFGTSTKTAKAAP